MFILLLCCLLPLISSLEYSLIIEEKSSINRTIFQFPRSYELINNFQLNFQLVNGKKDLILTKTIDRDLWCSQNICGCDQCTFLLELLSLDDRTISTMNVTITDINDHACQFLDIQENISLSESIQIGHRFPLARAIDYDSGLNGQLTFQLLDHSEYFQLNIITLSTNEYAIYGVVKRSFDRELKEKYELIIEGRDQGFPQVKINRTKVNIWILDENDNAPKFNQTEFSIQSLAEDTPVGTELLTIYAHDADKGPNGQIHYSIIVPSGQSSFPFSINSSSGVVRLQSALDYEKTRSYRVLIRASDSGLPQSLFTDSWLSISIKDVNDCPVEIHFTPNERFQYENQTLFIYENTEIQNLTLGMIRLTDQDSPSTKLSISFLSSDSNGKQLYELLPSNQLNVYLLMVKDGIFDREIQNEIQLHFLASDTSLTTNYHLRIRLIDLNDNPSEFPSNPMLFNVEELANYRMVEHPMETDQLTIGYLTVIDRDEGENAMNRYELDPNSFVRIDSITGRLYLIQPLDREEISNIFLKAKAINIAEPKWISEVQVQIHVTDVNDHLPHCSSPLHRISLRENVSIDQTLMKINATDRDQGDNGTIHYSLRTNSSWPFEIDGRTGEIYSREKFDYESNEKQFYIEIDLEDQGFPIRNPHRNACQVEILLEDVNDNRPELVNDDQRRIFIDLHQPFREEIVVFNVHDDDSGDQGRIRFRLISDDEENSLFILSSNGSLHMTRPSNDIGLFYLKILLEDHGVPPQQTLINVTIAIGDSSIPSFATFDQVLLKYSRPKFLGLAFGLTILIITVLLFISLIIICFCLRRHRRRHQAAIIARKQLLCSSSQHLTSSGSTTTTNTGSSTSMEHQILSSIIPIRTNFAEEKFYDQHSSHSYNVDSSSPESRTYKILHVPQDNEHFRRYFPQEKVDNHSSDLGYHGSYETASTSSPSQISMPRSYILHSLPDFVTKCKTVSEGFLVEMNVDGSDEDAR